jgi:hypothetical protein
MTCGSGALPLPPPPLPLVAARAVSEAARGVADAWARPLDPAGFGRALSQLYSILRDLGIGTRGLARYQTAGHPADPAPPDFPFLLEESAQRLQRAELSLTGVAAAEGIRSLPDPDESGATLCRAVRSAIIAWRQPAGPSDERDATIAYLADTHESLADAALNLTAYAPRRRAIALRAVAASLTAAVGILTRAIQPAPETGT